MKLIGGKAENLLKLRSNGFNVPPFEIIDSDTLEKILESTKKLKDIQIILNDKKLKIESKSKKIKKIILNLSFSKEFEEKLNYYFKNFNTKLVAIRSSSTVEDSDKYSFSGQFDSFLNVNQTNILEHILKCWASFYNENALKYMQDKKIDFDKNRPAIIIQKMINSELSAVAFSEHPNSKDNVLIELAQGLGTNLVDGNIKPFSFSINKKTKTITARTDKNKIKKEIIDCLFKIIIEIEKIYEKPIDIEFSIVGDSIYVLQVRPITTNSSKVISYIKSEYWGCFKNNFWSLYIRSMWIKGAREQKHKQINNLITEDITIIYPKNKKHLRVFNLHQPQIDKITQKNCLNETTISELIDKHCLIEKGNRKSALLIKKAISKNEHKKITETTLELIKQSSELHAYEYFINGLAQEYFKLTKKNKNTMDKINQWKNVPDKNFYPIFEEKLFAYLIKKNKMKIKAEVFKEAIHIEELIKLIEGKIDVNNLSKKLNNRFNNGFALLNLHSNINELIEEEKEYSDIKNYIESIQRYVSQKHIEGEQIKGKSTFKNGKVITSKAIVIKDLHKIKNKKEFEDKIVVVSITKANVISKLSLAKAIIVDHGGILSHAAIFSREFNIPTLMGCEVATQKIKSGDIVQYDVDKEIVFVKKNKA